MQVTDPEQCYCDVKKLKKILDCSIYNKNLVRKINSFSRNYHERVRTESQCCVKPRSHFRITCGESREVTPVFWCVDQQSPIFGNY